MSDHRIYQYTSIGRPLDPGYPTNKAVLILMPVAAVIGAAWQAYGGGQAAEMLSGALRFAFIALGGWALARELFPDDQAAAFISMVLALLAALRFDDPSLLLLFTTLMLVRLVNRTTGLPARKSDSIIVTLMVFGVIYLDASPFFAAAAALAFMLDGTLKDPLPRQWAFGLICLGGMIVYMVDHDVGFDHFHAPASLIEWVSIAVLLLLAANLLLLKTVNSVSDQGGEPLDVTRVKGGMAVALLAAAQGLMAIESVILVIMSAAGISLGAAFRKAFQAPASG